LALVRRAKSDFIVWRRGMVMDQARDGATEALIDAARRIRNYKLMQAKGYERIAKKAHEEQTKRLLLQISSDEAEDAEDWSERIRELAAEGGRVKSALMDFRVSLMMTVLGTRGFFEWAIIAEDEAVEDLLVRAGNLDDADASETWTRIGADERLHVVRMKKEILGMEGWEMEEGGGVRDVIFGANDGLVSILALVAGVYGAITDSHTILVAGLAGAVAGSISMGAGSYLSSKSEKEVTEKESDRKGIRKKRSPEEEREELTKFYQAKGFKEDEAEAIAARVSSRLELTEELTMGEELGLTSEEAWTPMKAGVLTALSFAIASVVPILPFAMLGVTAAVVTAAAASIASLFAVGASKAIFTRKSWILSGLEMTAIGTLAAAGTYVIGLAFPE
jgi:VIT1/CCC1 family predicted Fe2+/Mn2+ transporter/rubrerythrin